MANQTSDVRFPCEVLLPGREMVRQEVTEVVLPARDGEIGILAQHEDFIGLLGTGALKYVTDGNDYWLMVSSGMFQIVDGKLSVLAEAAEDAKEIDAQAAKSKLEEIEPQLKGRSQFDVGFERLSTELQRERARLEVHRRTNVLN